MGVLNVIVVFVFVVLSILDVAPYTFRAVLDAPVGVSQEEGHTGIETSAFTLRVLPLFLSREALAVPFPHRPYVEALRAFHIVWACCENISDSSSHDSTEI